MNHRQHLVPDGGMQAFVSFDLVMLQAYNLSDPARARRIDTRSTLLSRDNSGNYCPYTLLTHPSRPIGIRVGGNRGGVHCHTIPRCVRRYVTPAFDDGRMYKMFVQVGGVFNHTVLERATDGDVVEEREMLHIFTQPNAACMGTDRDAEPGGHEKDSQNLVYPADATGIDLADANGVGLK